MSKRPTVHVFLGAPPPSGEASARPPAGLTHLHLTWQDGHLQPLGPPPEAEAPPPGSVCEYLDGCFPAAPAEAPAKPGAPPLSEQTQYLSTWTLSHALVLRARGGGPGGATSPVSSSTPELFSQASPSPRAEQGGVVIEATVDGLLCSQEAAPADPPPRRPSPDRSSAAEASPAPPAAAAPPGRPLTPLARCDREGGAYSVLVAVVHPCHLKEIKTKTGPSAGAAVPLASIVVTDQSGAEVKVLLWRRAALWVLTVRPGDILLISGLQVSRDRWRGETVLQSTFASRLLNLGDVANARSRPAPQQVHAPSLASLCDHLQQRRPLLASLRPRPPQDLRSLPYVDLNSARVDTLVHATLRVAAPALLGTEWRSEAESRCRSAVQVKATVAVEQPRGQRGVLVLWGGAVQWLPRFDRSRGAVWDVRNLLVREGPTPELPELHATPWSSAQALEPSHPRARGFARRGPSRGGGSVELDLDTLLSQKYSGAVELRVQVTSFRFQGPPSPLNAPRAALDGSTPLDGVAAALGGDVTYTGCGRCAAELDTDANGIYAPCYPCLPHVAVRRYYRPGMLTVQGQGSSQVCVQVPPVLLQKILQAPPDRLHRSSAPGSEVKHIQVAAEKLHALLALPRKVVTATVRSHFLCDENSVPISQDFTLLDLQFS